MYNIPNWKFGMFHVSLQPFKYNCLKATGLIDIEIGTDKNAIGIVKHHKAGAASAENGPNVYKKVGKDHL